jgi:ligand-binding sensor domain-containing protein/signal transduction histidine kinase
MGVFIESVLFALVLLPISSCLQNKERYLTGNKSGAKIAQPRVTVLADLARSNKPVSILVENMPKPWAVHITKPPTVHLFKDPVTHAPLAPEAQGMGFFTTFTSDQGLALDAISSGIMDRKGNLWFGTLGGGVSRYDGKSFTNYTKAHGLAYNSVNRIKEDKWGSLWFGTSGGISRYDGKNFTNYTTAQGLAGDNVLDITEDKMGNLWLATAGGVSSYDGKSFTSYTKAHGLADNNVLSIIADKQGNLWFGTWGSGISSYDGKKFINYTTAQGLANDKIHYIMEDKKGDLWFATWGGGVSRYDGKSFTNYTTRVGMVSDFVRCINQDKAGNFWFGTLAGISCYDGKKFINYTTVHGLVNNDILSITEDKTGNLWIGTLGGGISRYNGKSFINYTPAQGLAQNLVLGIAEDKNGSLWFGTMGGGVSCYDGKSFINYTTEQGLVNNYLNGITLDKKGNLWFATVEGVSLYNGKSFTNETARGVLGSNFILSIIEDRKGSLWIGTLGGGVSRFDGKSYTKYTALQGLASNNILAITEDKTGNLWFATDGGGVSRYDGNSFTTYTTAQGLANNNVFHIKEDKTGNLWFGTGAGVSRYDGNSFINYTTANGLPDNNVWNIAIDSASNIIFGTNRGLGVLVSFTSNATGEKIGNHISTQNSLSNVELKNYTPQFEIYNSSTGYPFKDVNIQGTFTDSKGILWIGTGAAKIGLVRFDYSAIHKSSDPLVVTLQNIKVNNENICWYNLLPASYKKHVKSDSNTIASNITEEVSTLGKVLSEADRDSMRSKSDGIKFDSIRSFYPIPENLVLPYYHNSVTIDFAAIEINRPQLVKYQYILEGYDKEWSSFTNKTSATYGNIYEGTYIFKLKAQSPYGVWSEPLTYTFRVLPPYWRTWWAYTLYILIFLVTIWSLITWRIRTLKKEKTLLEKKVTVRTHELQEEKEKVESTLSELKSTQAQLIQSEKMASLGQVTAGIAHEIQNPLNFVNNFSDVNRELVVELKEEARSGNIEEVLAIAGSIEENEERIAHHGRRADSIVKGMLQHSRVTTGHKESTNINALADEYLRLSSYGMRAKDKNFNVEIKTDFDTTIGKINVVPQDIGRVLLNLFNNAFYAVNEKKKTADETYQPLVSVQTKKLTDKVEIKVSDNGNGIPQKIVDKIFQPFFTTKPTGQGTGLGLSLSYDTIKGHGGEIRVQSKEGEGSKFVFQLPEV